MVAATSEKPFSDASQFFFGGGGVRWQLWKQGMFFFLFSLVGLLLSQATVSRVVYRTSLQGTLLESSHAASGGDVEDSVQTTQSDQRDAQLQLQLHQLESRQRELEIQDKQRVREFEEGESELQYMHKLELAELQASAPASAPTLVSQSNPRLSCEVKL